MRCSTVDGSTVHVHASTYDMVGVARSGQQRCQVGSAVLCCVVLWCGAVRCDFHQSTVMKKILST